MLLSRFRIEKKFESKKFEGQKKGGWGDLKKEEGGSRKNNLKNLNSNCVCHFDSQYL